MTDAVDDRLFNLAVNTQDPQVRVELLAERVRVLTKEKEEIEESFRAYKLEEQIRYQAHEIRIAAMEKTFTMGAGVFLALPIIGSVIVLLLTFGGKIFAPWNKP